MNFNVKDITDTGVGDRTVNPRDPTETKGHTPGPWTYKANVGVNLGTGGGQASRKPAYVVESPSEHLWIVETDHEANAALIAAAPETAAERDRLLAVNAELLEAGDKLWGFINGVDGSVVDASWPKARAHAAEGG